MKLILASKSPRRKFLLDQMGLDFDIIPSDFEEYFDDDRPVEDVVKELGLGKARSVAKDHPGEVVIGSDLMVVHKGRQIGKPEDLEDAKQRLRELSDDTHELIASVAVICSDRGYEEVRVAYSKVTFGELSEEFIEKYVLTGTTMDKAAGYAIQHPMVKSHVKSFEGRMDTIIGMPTDVLAEMLNELGIECEPLDLSDENLLTLPGFFE